MGRLRGARLTGVDPSRVLMLAVPAKHLQKAGASIPSGDSSRGTARNDVGFTGMSLRSARLRRIAPHLHAIPDESAGRALQGTPSRSRGNRPCDNPDIGSTPEGAVAPDSKSPSQFRGRPGAA